MEQASGAAKDGNEENPQTPFCAGEVGMISAPGWVKGLIEDPETGCPDMVANLGVFALPGADGEPAPVLLGGSDIAISAKSKNQDLAQDVVGLMLSDDYQKLLAEAGLTPAKNSLASELGNDEFAAGDHRRGVQRQAHPGRAGLGRGRGLAGPRGPVRRHRQGRRRRGAGRGRRRDRSPSSSTS